MAQALPEDVEGISSYLRALRDMENGENTASTGNIPQKRTTAKQHIEPPEKMVRIYDEYGSWTEVPESIIGNVPMGEFTDEDVENQIYNPQSPVPKQNTGYVDPYENEYLDNASTTKSAPVRHVHNGKEWVLKEEVSTRYSTVKTYSICSSYTGYVVVNDIMMYESAVTVLNLMNNGKALSDPKVLGIIASGIEYGTVVFEAMSYAEKRNKALNKRDYQEAMKIDEDIEVVKGKAESLRDSVLKYLKDEGYLDGENK